MRTFRTVVAAAVLGGIGFGCGKETTKPPVPPPPPSAEKPLGKPGAPKAGLTVKQRKLAR